MPKLKPYLRALKNGAFGRALTRARDIVMGPVGVISGLHNFYLRDGISRLNSARILRAHCATNGWFTETLNAVTHIIRPPRPPGPANGLLGMFDIPAQRQIVEAIRRDGYYVFSQKMPAEFCDEIQTFASGVNTVVEGWQESLSPLIPYDPSHPVSRTYKVRECDSVVNKAVQRLLADSVFISIAEAYLNTQPTIGGVDMWWSALYGNEPGSDAAQLFHFDFDAPPAWLKLFVYITDVGPENGPHVYVRGSHRAGLAKAREFRARGYERIEDSEISAMFGSETLTEITGERGTVFIADTRGFHKGKMPREGDRLITQILYCAPLFNDRGKGPNLPETPEPSLASALYNMPAVYDRYRKPRPVGDR